MERTSRNSTSGDLKQNYNPPSTLQPNLQTVVVTIKPGEMVKKFSDQFFAYLEVAAGSIPLTEKEVHDYICYLIEARVKHVCGRRSLPKSDFAVKIPCFIHFLLSQIGNVDQASAQLRIIPEFERTENMVLTKDDDIYQFVTKVASIINIIAPNALARGFPSSTEGNIDFMSMTLVGDIMKCNHANVEPVMAFASSFLEAKRMSDLMTSHVSYGSLSRYASFIHDVSSTGIVRSQR